MMSLRALGMTAEKALKVLGNEFKGLKKVSDRLEPFSTIILLNIFQKLELLGMTATVVPTFTLDVVC